ncbi:helix-turn-helix transcriptional regulator [Ostreibacterium oceani]|uniref:AlpA family phage regulatory protein n=1 Tax=Ostreibacterium oceani TaxID=2654998 RepID=A0A6N7EVU4_9GAMM|nr:AlpA family phage regulatory protein [Ostreibacterium oceani]MPV86884.1 AlpA family phage regulatory protein [Ostreibacterium oceani]
MRVINKTDLLKKLPFKKSTLYQRINDGFFPAGILTPVSAHAVWDEDVVDAWLILAYGLNKPMPDLHPEDLAVVKSCIARLQRDGLQRDGLQRDGLATSNNNKSTDNIQNNIHNNKGKTI